MTTPATRLTPLILAVLAQLAAPAHAAAAAPGCQYTMVAKLPIRYSGPSLSLTVDGTINGTPAAMLIDTGSYDTTMTRTGADRRGLVLRNTGQLSYGIGGSSRILSTKVRELSVGQAATKGYLRVIGDTAYTPNYDAVIGAPFLLQADLEFSLATKELKFFRPTNCRDTFLGYWGQDVIEIPFEASPDSSPNPHFTVLLNGHKLDAIIDSGASSTVVDLEAAKRAGLKLDAPGTARAGVAVGVGERSVALWTSTADTLSIGPLIINNPRFGIVDTKDTMSADVVLGADFLRAHRVLFAMSQKKIYLSYVGGDPLGQPRKLESWIVREGETGNADAQYALYRMYDNGWQTPKNKAQAQVWLERAAALGQPHANIETGERLLLEGQHGEAARRLRAALDQLPAERHAALWLYLARVRGNQVELGRQELATRVGRSEEDEWPVPIAHHFLGKIDSAELLKRARADKTQGRRRACMAQAFMMHLDAAKAGSDGMAADLAAQQLECAAPVPGKAPWPRKPAERQHREAAKRHARLIEAARPGRSWRSCTWRRASLTRRARWKRCCAPAASRPRNRRSRHCRKRLPAQAGSHAE